MSGDESEQLIIGLIIMAVPTLFLIVFLVRTAMWRTVARAGEHTEGTIVSKRTKHVGDGGKQYLATVEYPDRNLVTVSKEFNIGRTAHKALGLGTPVPLIFDPDRPKRARLGPVDRLPPVLRDSKRTQRLAIGVLAIVLGLFFVIGAVTATGALV